MNKFAVLAITFGIATGSGLAFRESLYVPAAASSHQEAAPEPLQRIDARDSKLDSPPAPERPASAELRLVSGRPLEANTADLLIARRALDSGTFLLNRARANPRNSRMAEQAVLHLRACLSHEGQAREAGSLFGDARRNLEEAERLLASANAPAPAPKQAVTPVPEAAPAPSPPASLPKRQPRQSVGPDGVIYESPGE